MPTRLWDMLLNHSPDLAELTLDGTCNTYQLWNIRGILSGRWPRMKTISLGSLSSHEFPSDDKDMASFLSAHPTLQEIQFLSGMYYSRSSMVYLPALPQLYSFNGRIQQLKLAGDLLALRSLHLTDWFSPSARFTEMLLFFPRITSLSIYVNFLDSISRPNCLALYQRVLSACPQLNHVEISATGPIVLVRPCLISTCSCFNRSYPEGFLAINSVRANVTVVCNYAHSQVDRRGHERKRTAYSKSESSIATVHHSGCVRLGPRRPTRWKMSFSANRDLFPPGGRFAEAA